MTTCPSCGNRVGPGFVHDDPLGDVLPFVWTCTCCGNTACHGCMAQYPGTSACAECRGMLQADARAQGSNEIPVAGQQRENLIGQLFAASWQAHLATHPSVS